VRVSIVAPWGERLGGAEQILWTMLQHFDPARFQPSVVFLSPGAFVDEVRAMGIPAEVVRAGRLRHAARTAITVRELAASLRSTSPSVVLNWAAKTQIFGAPAAALAGLRHHVVWWQQSIPDGHWIDRAATALPARTVICYSDAAARAQRKLRPRRDIEVVHAGAPAAHAVRDPAGVRRSLGIPDGRISIGIIGRLQPWKGQHHVIRAVGELIRRGLPVHGVVVGGAAFGLSPEYEPKLHALARSLGVSQHVTFTGQQADAPRYLSAFDVLVNASNPEPYGLVLLEAMANGVPTVAFAAGGPLDIVADGETGLLVPQDDPDGLVTALETLVLDADLRRALGDAGRTRAKSFSQEDAARAVERVLERAAARRRPGAATQ
jgi:glycosyltransferase involved in cell wall biosynthesis